MNTKNDHHGQELLLKEECYHIVGACFDVYRNKGNGFLESVYQECLALEYAIKNIPFEEKPHLKLKYKEYELKQTY